MYVKQVSLHLHLNQLTGALSIT